MLRYKLTNDRKLLEWYKREMELLNVEVRLNTAADQAAAQNEKADIVMVAATFKPIQADFGCTDITITASGAVLSKKPVGQKVLIVGSGLVCCETALWLAQQGREVTIVEMLFEIAGGPHGMPFMNCDMLKDELNFHNVKIYRKKQAHLSLRARYHRARPRAISAFLQIR